MDRKAWLQRGLVTVLFAGLLAGLAAPLPHSLAAGPYNIVFIMTDDQRWDTLCGGPDELPGICAEPTEDHPMPTVETELIGKGVLFTNAFVTNPLCCPSRAGFHSGGFFSHHTNVLSVNLPNGGVTQFRDSTTMATLLQQNGYKTALIGKYLNGYSDLVDRPNNETYIPPGWDLFAATFGSMDWNNRYEFASGSSTYDQPGTGTLELVNDGTYLTDAKRDKALAFIDAHCQYQQCDSPFFLMLSTDAPHEPATPAPRHVGLFSDFQYRGRGYDELPGGDLSDKPIYVQNAAASFDPVADDVLHRDQLESLRAVDEAVAAILDNLEAKDLLNNTVFVFVADNGYMWGEHRMTKKTKPYEESIRVPLVIRAPNSAPGVVDRLIAADLDLAPTILEYAGIAPLASDGMSLMPLILNPATPWRDSLLIQGLETHNGLPAWATIRTEDNWKYTEYVTGEEELYSLVEDPYELTSRHADPAYQVMMTDLAGRLAELNRGVAIRTDNFRDPQSDRLAAGGVGRRYRFQFSAWGGNGTYSWSVFTDASSCTGALPGGLVLGTNGRLSGTPTAAGTWTFCVKVQDTSPSPQPGNERTQAQIKTFSLKIR